MSKSSKLVFFGNERLATGLNQISAPTLRRLIEQGYDIAAVVSHYSSGHSRSSRPLEIAGIAKQHNIPVLLPENLSEVQDQLQNIGAVAAVLVAYGKIIPKEIIEIFPKGIINIHPSLLPNYRGPTPIEQAILDGCDQTGVSIMELTTAMDAGPLYAQTRLELKGDESKENLAEKLLELGSQMLLEILPGILNGTLNAHAQDDSRATYTKLLKKDDGVVDWNKDSKIIERQVRAFMHWPKSRSSVMGHNIILTKVRVAKDKNDGALVIPCQPGCLEIQELVAPSGRKITGAEFLRGYAKN
jgi:methionyl-tRNA formyltransferase